MSQEKEISDLQPAAAPIPLKAQLRRVMDLLDTHLGDSDPTLEGMTQEEIEEEFPVVAAMQIIVGLYQDPPTASDTAPSPADERAALSEDRIDWIANAHCPGGTAYPVNVKNAIREALREARAASANETGAEGAKTEAEIRKSMTSEQIQLERKLTCEAIDGAMAFGYQNTNPPPSADHWLAPYWHVGRKQAELESRSPAMAAEAVAWVRKHPDTGELAGDWLWDGVIEQCRKDSGVWFPLGFLDAPQPAQADARDDSRDAKDARYFRWLCAHPDWRFIEALCQKFVAESQVEFYTKLSAEIERRMKHGANKGKKRLSDGSLAFQQAAAEPQADARVGLTAEQRASITWAIRAAVECGYTADADVLRALLQGANHA
ncbi:hypothetical protein ABEG10_23205 [Burkholderia cenocepacia]|uniref:hypothetical protein n=1 Tax=Burkholderia cenocepacia TaxID=95486 RepID=UPI0020A14CFE|nr:hypothetical protein [Burkholderia cenocepacia]MCO8325949.1 hypothetical protein [Burkholderia cenocepacia]MCO8333019.1 hypothetical protein [Burkholderia cenocepacia]MCO8340519.1 hypothetical protein [Burkholderia cenocepacia]MCO8347805.1 hypothetical protein [Burkholderia cenocepacia]MCO8360871.1 hypothetical protein [Burkholderia cenocepacia]